MINTSSHSSQIPWLLFLTLAGLALGIYSLCMILIQELSLGIFIATFLFFSLTGLGLVLPSTSKPLQ